jgi:hypothetical protein
MRITTRNLIQARKHLNVFPSFFCYLSIFIFSFSVIAKPASPLRTPAQASKASNTTDPSLVGCVETKSLIQGRIDARNKNFIEIPAEQIVSFVGKNKSGTFYRVRFGDQLLWVPSNSVKHVGLEKCSIAKEVIRAEDKLKFEVYLGYFFNSQEDALKNLLVSVPDPSSVASLPNPIVSEVKKGKGFEIGACGQIPVWKIHISGCAGYLRESFTIVSRPNPSPPSDTVTLDSLLTSETTYNFQAILGQLSAKYLLRLNKKNQIGFGLGMSSSYYLGEAQSFEYRTGTVFKAESTIIPFGPKGFVIKPVLQLGYDYQFLTGSFIQSIGLTVEYKTTGDIGLKLGFGL